VSREQRMAADLVRQLDATGKPYDITKLEKQLGKVLKGEELQGALAFALATKEYDTQGLESPSQRELQRAAKQREAKAEEQAVADDAAITADLEGELDQQALFMKRLQRDTTTDRDILGSRIAASLAAEREAVVPSPAPSRRSVDLDVEVDPTDPRFVYRETADGYQVIQEGRDPYNVPRNSRAARSIEQVLAGGAALPPRRAAPAPAPTPAPAPAPAAVDSAAALAGYTPDDSAAPAGEAEPPSPPAFDYRRMSDEELEAYLR